MIKLFIILISGMGASLSFAQPLPIVNSSEPKYDLVGSLDGFNEDKLTVSDEVFQITNLTNCYALSGRKDIGCYGLKDKGWVGVKLYGDAKQAAISKVKSVFFISESEYQEFLKDD